MRKRFRADTLSKAKTKALKWVGKYVMCKDTTSDVSYTFERSKDDDAEVIVTLFTSIDETEQRERHCSICREFHKTFFINENINCNECKAKAYQQRLSDMLKVKKSHYRAELKKAMGGADEE